MIDVKKTQFFSEIMPQFTMRNFYGIIEKFKGQKLHNLFRLRVGKFRVAYVLEEDIVRITNIDTRGDV